MQIGVDADVTDFTVPVPELARAVEDAGLESLLFTHRTHLPASQREVLAKPGHEMDAQLLDPFVALGAAAAVTSRIKLGTGACKVAAYDPLILAKQVATLDHVSGGRALFGITPGWDDEEIANHGVAPRDRWRALDEKVRALKALWTEDDVRFDGQHVSFEPVLLGLRPLQRPHPPILVGSHGPYGLRRVVEYGDEWFPVLTPTRDLEGDMATLAGLCHAAGRAPAAVTVFLWELDEAALSRCADAGVARCVVYLFPTDRDELASSLSRLGDAARAFL